MTAQTCSRPVPRVLSRLTGVWPALCRRFVTLFCAGVIAYQTVILCVKEALYGEWSRVGSCCDETQAPMVSATCLLDALGHSECRCWKHTAYPMPRAYLKRGCLPDAAHPTDCREPQHGGYRQAFVPVHRHRGILDAGLPGPPRAIVARAAAAFRGSYSHTIAPCTLAPCPTCHGA